MNDFSITFTLVGIDRRSTTRAGQSIFLILFGLAELALFIFVLSACGRRGQLEFFRGHYFFGLRLKKNKIHKSIGIFKKVFGEANRIKRCEQQGQSHKEMPHKRKAQNLGEIKINRL